MNNSKNYHNSTFARLWCGEIIPNQKQRVHLNSKNISLWLKWTWTIWSKWDFNVFTSKYHRSHREGFYCGFCVKENKSQFLLMKLIWICFHPTTQRVLVFRPVLWSVLHDPKLKSGFCSANYGVFLEFWSNRHVTYNLRASILKLELSAFAMAHNSPAAVINDRKQKMRTISNVDKENLSIFIFITKFSLSFYDFQTTSLSRANSVLLWRRPSKFFFIHPRPSN